MRSLSSPHLSAEDRIPLLPTDSLMTNCCLHALDAPSRRDESRDACQMSRVSECLQSLGYRPKCVYGPGVSAASGPAFSGPKAFFGAEAGVVFGWAEGFFFHLRRVGGARVFELLLGGLPGVVGELSQSI